jgi:hypothetical protein
MTSGPSGELRPSEPNVLSLGQLYPPSELIVVDGKSMWMMDLNRANSSSTGESLLILAISETASSIAFCSLKIPL